MVADERGSIGDLVEGRVFSIDPKRRGSAPAGTPIEELSLYDTSGKRMRMTDFVDDGRVDLRFGTDADQNLYLLAKANGSPVLANVCGIAAYVLFFVALFGAVAVSSGVGSAI